MPKQGENKERKAPAWVTLMAAAFAGGLFASVATVATGYLTFSNRDRKLDIQFVNISLGILRGEHDVADVSRNGVIAARKFAILTISRLAETELSEAEIKAWSEGASTPFDDSQFGLVQQTSIRLAEIRECVERALASGMTSQQTAVFCGGGIHSRETE